MFRLLLLKREMIEAHWRDLANSQCRPTRRRVQWISLFVFLSSGHGEIGLDQRRGVGLIDQAGFVGGDLNGGGVFKVAAVQAKGPVVPGTDGAVVFDVSGSEGAAGVGAVVVHHVGLAMVEEDGELVAVDFDVFAFAFGEVCEGAESGPSHESSGRWAVGSGQ
jgi:hypothetical protein